MLLNSECKYLSKFRYNILNYISAHYYLILISNPDNNNNNN